MKRKERKPIEPERIEVPEKHPRVRLVLTIALIVIAVAAFGFAAYQATRTDTGWQTIDPAANAQTTASTEFTLTYKLGASGMDARSERNALSARYTAALDAASRAVSNVSVASCSNVYYLNRHVNETVAVDPILYNALATVADAGSRYIYLAPIFAQYDGLFQCTADYETADYDPYQNDALRAEFAQAAAFAADPQAVGIELLGDNRVKLTVSEAYRAFAQEHAITDFVDFYLLENAFIIDYTAEELIGAGFVYGTISSYDGYSRTLGDAGDAYALNLNCRVGNTVYAAAVMEHTGALASVTVRNYPMTALDSLHYYSFETGEIRTPYIDAADGLSKTACGELVCFSRTQGCAAIGLALLPLYSTDTLDLAALRALPEIDSVYCEGFVLHYTSDEVRIGSLLGDIAVTFSAVYDPK